MEPATATYQTTAIQARVPSSPAVPIAKPAAAQMNSTLGFATVRTAAVSAARGGVTLLMLCIQRGVCAERLRVNQR